MKLAIMQPYLFPYIGYFQLIHAVDTFVVYDDVAFIKGGWINRNFIFAQGVRQMFSLQLEGASPNKNINQINVGSNTKKILKTIQQNYSKAPEFDVVILLINKILSQKENNLSSYIEQSLRLICEYLGINVKWMISSNIKKDNTLRGQDKILSICKELGATEYINLPGGRGLYNHEVFRINDIRLSFINPTPIHYPQFNYAFVPDLSIIDVMMFNNKNHFSSLLQEYQVVR